MLGDYSKRPKLNVRDDLPRFLPFSYTLANASQATHTAPPCMKRFTLPYQVLPNGRILASQILKIEFNWSPVFFYGASETISNDMCFRRFVLDAVQQPVQQNGILVPVASPDATTTVISAPYEQPSVLKVFDRFCGVNSTTTAGTDSLSTSESLHEEYEFNCCGNYPIVPSGSLCIWGFWISSNGHSSQDICPITATNLSRWYTDSLARAIDYPVPSTGWGNDNGNVQPFVSGRIWYRTVELEPYQHIMIVDKYTNKRGDLQTDYFDKLLNTNTGTNSQYNQTLPNVSANPQRSDASNITIWKGS